MTAEPIASRPQAALSTLCRNCLALVAAGGGACPAAVCRASSRIRSPAISPSPTSTATPLCGHEKRDDPSLLDKPVIVGHAGGRGVVTTACYVARRYGPRSAMPMFRALEPSCPDAMVIPPDMPEDKQVSRQILRHPEEPRRRSSSRSRSTRPTSICPPMSAGRTGRRRWRLAGIALGASNVTSASPSRSASASTSSWRVSRPISTSRAALR